MSQLSQSQPVELRRRDSRRVEHLRTNQPREAESDRERLERFMDGVDDMDTHGHARIV